MQGPQVVVQSHARGPNFWLFKSKQTVPSQASFPAAEPWVSFTDLVFSVSIEIVTPALRCFHGGTEEPPQSLWILESLHRRLSPTFCPRLFLRVPSLGGRLAALSLSTGQAPALESSPTSEGPARRGWLWVLFRLVG